MRVLCNKNFSCIFFFSFNDDPQVCLFNKIDWKKLFWPSILCQHEGRLKKWLFGNIQFHLWTRRSIFGFGIEQVLFAQELAGIRPLGRSLLALSLPDNSNIIKRWCEFHSQLSLLTLWNLEIPLGPAANIEIL